MNDASTINNFTNDINNLTNQNNLDDLNNSSIIDYYKLLEINYNSSIEDIKKICDEKIIECTIFPFLNDKNKIKNIKKALYILTNPEYKIIYDKVLKSKLLSPQPIYNDMNPVYNDMNSLVNSNFQNQNNMNPLVNSNFQNQNDMNPLINSNFQNQNNMNPLVNSNFQNQNDMNPLVNSNFQNQNDMNPLVNSNFQNQNDMNPLVNSNFQNQYNLSKKTLNNSYITDRIFGLTNNSFNNSLLQGELLRPQNTGLAFDNKPEFEKPLDFETPNELQPYNFYS